MLEKNGSIVLTEEDKKEYNEGKVSKRIKDTWGLSFTELKAVVDESKNKTQNTETK